MSTAEGKSSAVVGFSKGNSNIELNEVIKYKEMWGDKDLTENEKETIKKRKEQYSWLVNKYYDLATTFYEWGWGNSFHFAPRWKWESRQAGMHRLEYYIALRLKAEKGHKIVDLGCGIGGPGRNIARFSEANVIGVNNHPGQIKRAKEITAKENMSHLCSYIKADFMNIPLEDGSLDGAYQIEAACHSPDKVKLYKEIFRVLKPGAYFAGYEWVMTKQYDNSNKKTQNVKERN